ncbi:hypothetical protein AMAG_02130 [Allomyces macrogynus ATCC 38327]|uniref:Serine aminopeptidase S33 domain-containing protein n=1 Tax=Allomyces macrogynus (strain ATCC 38327) TaxID=578462 RepID=A0A0L0S1M8_ALLM3|nr:hypothetical protein AMAG_02130 [Allomyces macrogynus ATCC 38327]|eukprot:KNE56306.1 hypothetical protein AMAG_02130 [Allomyces macrogynus ATCC 38327]
MDRLARRAVAWLLALVAMVAGQPSAARLAALLALITPAFADAAPDTLLATMASDPASASSTAAAAVVAAASTTASNAVVTAATAAASATPPPAAAGTLSWLGTLANLPVIRHLIPRTAWGTVLAAVPVALAALVLSVQNQLIYPADFPPGSRDHVDAPDKLGLPYEDVELRTPDGVKLRAYFIKPMRDEAAAARPTLLYLHANAGNMGHRLPIADIMHSTLGWNVFMLSYRGYGKSEGSPSESGLRIDAQTALDYLQSHPVASTTPILVFGQSIGGAVAIDLVARNPHRVAALLIENTFLSIPKLIPSVIPVLRPLAFLCHQIWASHRAIATIPQNVPILFLSSARDELIPPAHMRELYVLAGGTQVGREGGRGLRTWREFALGTHNDAPLQPRYFESLNDFYTTVVVPAVAAKKHEASWGEGKVLGSAPNETKA